MALGVISGSGLYDFELLAGSEREEVKTPYGEALIYRATVNGKDICFLPRHGKEHSVLPHMINYRANICALKQYRVNEIMAFCCVGSLTRDLPPGSLVMLDQFIDFTYGREHTFAAPGLVAHTDMTHPYCPRLSKRVLELGREAGLKIAEGGVYVCTQGPRFETPAEIKAFALLGGTVVGMTGVPEAQLAREAGICYASLAMIANFAAGMQEAISGEEVNVFVNANKENIEVLLRQLIEKGLGQRDCGCAASMIKACQLWK